MSEISSYNAAQTEALNFFHRYLDVLFEQRDLEGVLSLLDEAMTGFGTGAGEVGQNREQSIALYRHDITHAPNPIYYQINQQQLVSLVDHQAYQFSAVLRLETEILAQQLVFNHLRITLIGVKKNGQWSLVHLHASFPTSEHCDDEPYPVKELEERNAWLEKRVKEKTHALEDALVQLKKVAETDKLTGLYNRHYTDRLLAFCIEQAEGFAQTFSVLLIDVDLFKRVNDQYGHLIGDKLLMQVSERLQMHLRKDDSIGRWGGEEFLIICPQLNAQDASLLAERICCQIASKPFDRVGQQTLSIGVTSYRVGDDFDHLISRADSALYQAKKQGRNCAVTQV
ncbi:diguanylate cyclase [Thiomicrospira microaerophila]|uniref:diguanylate cyclase n=1 Tax=Thiomicrospira microaerophila TaxID=406020 RepID=UPI00200DE84B|nr:diguanylate cyclase [Thiomicrospira microaerophila]UQB42134.1 diguanylate cyclase [Thiomicrospira microaerophila]